MGGEWPLVGRGAELGQLRQLLNGGAGRGVVLAGRAGVGKTRLGVEFLAFADQTGLATAQATATRSAAEIALGALTPLLSNMSGGDTLKKVTAGQAGLLHRATVALLERSGGRRLVLMVDDAHLLDAASAALIHQLAAANKAFVVLTIRAGEAAPDPIHALWKDGILERVEVSGLQAEAVHQLLCSVLGGPVDPATSALLAVRCEGNVLFLRELVMGALSDGTIDNAGGIWRVVGDFRPSERLVELVEFRLAGLENVERALLELVAFGEALGTAELGVLFDPALVDRLERKALLSSRLDGRRLEVRLAHPIYGDVLRARMSAWRVRELARILADALENTGARRRDDRLAVATRRLSAGDPTNPAALFEAALIARWRYDFPLGERLARAAVDAGAGFDAELLAYQLAGLQGRTEEAKQSLAVLAGRAADDRERTLVALARLDIGSHVEDTMRIIEDARAAVQDPHWGDQISARRAWVLLVTQGPAAAAAASEPLVERAGGEALVWACLVASNSFARQGRISAALDASQRGYDAHLALSRPLDWYPWTHLFNSCEALARAGRFAEAEAVALSQYRQAIADHSPEAQAFFAWHLASTVGERGHVATAARYGREAMALFRQLGRWLYARQSGIAVLLALSLAGQGSEADEVLRALDGLPLPPAGYGEVEFLLARAWRAVAAGDLRQARDHLWAAADLAEQSGDRTGEVCALHGLARLGKAADVVPRVAAVAEGIEGGLGSARACHTRALAADDPLGFAEASAAFEAAGAHLLAAEAAAEEAVAWRRSGDLRKAKPAAQRAAVMAGRCEGAATPGLLAVDDRARLTAAEWETALMAAAGRSNHQIAQELILSVRTVENRLNRVYSKMGVSNRSQLAEAVRGLASEAPSN